MSSNTLYLKYRPQNLEEIVGQEELVKVLQNSAKTGNIAHAYLFSGGRGTGKTTTARAFAKELGIHKDDILELDAASHGGVEEFKNLLESVHTLPYFSKYKMYILDEIHMLTKHASNAFLKTLEEPPTHCIFVLCTTDPEKMLDTILSRCTKFNLKSPNQETLAKFLADVAKKENQKIDKEAIQLIALTGDGSYRDSLSNLQKVFSFTDEKYTEDFVSKILGVPQISAIFTYLKALDGIIENKDGIEILQSLENSGVDYLLFAKEVTYFARIVLLARHKLISDTEIKENYGEHILEFVKEFLTAPGHTISSEGSPKINSVVLSKIIDAEITSKNSSLPFLAYELLLL
jgi:DNA polymerase-3 subunit gamma/tau